ncbi:MAG: hypothetical protein U0744_12020 [Gemmataceae bacterium]
MLSRYFASGSLSLALVSRAGVSRQFPHQDLRRSVVAFDLLLFYDTIFAKTDTVGDWTRAEYLFSSASISRSAD